MKQRSILRSRLTFTVLLLLIFSAIINKTEAQNNLGVNTTTPHASAVLDVSSTTQGVLVPRMTMAQRDAIATPATGLMIFQTDNTPGFYFYNGSAWAVVGVPSVSGTFFPRTTNTGYIVPSYFQPNGGSTITTSAASVHPIYCFPLPPNTTVSLDVTSYEDEGMVIKLFPVAINNSSTAVPSTTAVATLTLAASTGGTTAVAGTLSYKNTTNSTQVLIFSAGRSDGAGFSSSNTFFTTFRMY